MIITPGVEIGLLFCFQNSFYAYYFSFVSWESITWAVVMGIRGDGGWGKGNGGVVVAVEGLLHKYVWKEGRGGKGDRRKEMY